MRKFFVAVLANCFLLTAAAQSSYWQQQVNYTIDVSLNDKTHTLDGFERIEYINNSPDTLRYIWFHLWPNAYKNDKTAFSDQLLRNGRTDFYFSDQEDKGYINRLDFKVNDVTAETEDHPEHIDIVKLVLPSPLPPAQKAIITTPFHVKLPKFFSRSGHDGQSYQATQWYPKPAVYDSKGWHPMPYLDQGEFYSEFGSFDVSITLPQNYVVAATGDLQNEEEKEWLKTRANFEWTPAQKKVKTSGGQIKTITEKFPPSSSAIKTIRYKQDRVHDFAWFADKRFVVRQDTCKLPSGKIITVGAYFFQESGKNSWIANDVKPAAVYYSSELGEYPYNTLSIVRGPTPHTYINGMEYPTITLINANNLHETGEVIFHEIGHNWFYGILGSNEREYPWMDEGMNTFYEKKAYSHAGENKKYEQALFQRYAIQKRDQPVATHSEKLSELNYFLSSYYKASEWMRHLESQVGETTLREAMQEYYRRWQFKHPYREDFKQVLEEKTGRNLDAAFAYLDKKGLLPNQENKNTRFISLFPRLTKGVETIMSSTDKNLYWISPALGANEYDGLMVGAALSNYKVAPSRLQFFLAPMYGIQSKEFTGIGLVNYSAYPDGIFKRIDIGVSASKFSYNEFKKEDGKFAYFGFEKLAPRLRLTFKEKDPRSTMNRYIQFKTYLFNEEEYRIRYDSTFLPNDTVLTQVVRTLKESRTLNQFTLVFENHRVLYPYRAELKIEQAKDFVRAAFTGNYCFNYAKGGGLKARFFAGKFFYTTAKTTSKRFQTDRFHLNMTGANGYEDYTYSDYFQGRNKFEGLASQQIMERDGAFKVRTDLLGDKVGKTDDWLIAANFSTTIPSGLNPLSLLPVKIPLSFFVDIGTYADAWKRDANEDRFLFDAGLHIPIGQTINIYIPLIYSKVFKDYKLSYMPEKGRFWRMISYSIDISNFNLGRIHRRLLQF